MEIKCVKKEKIEYPKINEIGNKKIKHSIPDKWLKLGVTSFLFNVLMQSKAFATFNTNEIFADVAGIQGAELHYDPIYNYIKCGCNITTLISALAVIISLIMTIIRKLKAKKQGENTKVSKKIKLVFIISVILLILSRIGFLIADYLNDANIYGF